MARVLGVQAEYEYPASVVLNGPISIGRLGRQNLPNRWDMLLRT